MTDVDRNNLKIVRDAVYVRDLATGLKKYMGCEERVVIADKDGNKMHAPKSIVDELDGLDKEVWEGQGFDITELKKAKVVK